MWTLGKRTFDNEILSQPPLHLLLKQCALLINMCTMWMDVYLCVFYLVTACTTCASNEGVARIPDP